MSKWTRVFPEDTQLGKHSSCFSCVLRGPAADGVEGADESVLAALEALPEQLGLKLRVYQLMCGTG